MGPSDGGRRSGDSAEPDVRAETRPFHAREESGEVFDRQAKHVCRDLRMSGLLSEECETNDCRRTLYDKSTPVVLFFAHQFSAHGRRTSPAVPFRAWLACDLPA